MRLKGQGLGHVDGDLGCTVLVGDVNSPRAIFVVKPGICPDQLAPLFPFLSLSFPATSGSLAAKNNGQCKCQSGGDASFPRRSA